MLKKPSFAACQILLALGLCLGGNAPVQALTNGGGVLLLHADPDLPYELGMEGICQKTALRQWNEANTRLPSDGQGHVVVVYAAFPPDSVGQLGAISFGARYSPSVRIVTFGACNGNGVVIPSGEWPKSGTGVSFSFNNIPAGSLLPIYYFVLTAKGPGYFELTPNPVPTLGASFANPDVPSLVEPVAGFGKIGFELEGFLPEPGPREARGACCLEMCRSLTAEECAFFKGVYLGEGVSCDSKPCDAEAERGGCCLPTGCRRETRLNCKLADGIFYGESSSCDTIPCPSVVPGEPKIPGSK